MSVPDGADERDVLTAALEEQFQPLHNLDKLDALAQEIDGALLAVWGRSVSRRVFVHVAWHELLVALSNISPLTWLILVG